MLKIGLTGGIGSGKSFISELFSKWGSYVFDADKKSKEILFNNETTQNEIIAEFGTDVLGLDKKIDNQKLANIAFQNEDYQLRLNSFCELPYLKEVLIFFRFYYSNLFSIIILMIGQTLI